MRGLIKKDFYNCYLTSPVWLVFMLFYIVLGVAFEQDFLLIFSAMLPALLVNTVISSDENGKWEQLALAMPVSRRELVLSRYLFGFLNIALIGAIVGVTALVCRLLHMTGVASRVQHYPLIMAIGVIMLCINIPFETKYGGTKGRMIAMISTILIMGVVGGLQVEFSVAAGLLIAFLELAFGNGAFAFYSLLLLLLAFLFFLSYRFALRFAERKDY